MTGGASGAGGAGGSSSSSSSSSSAATGAAADGAAVERAESSGVVAKEAEIIKNVTVRYLMFRF